jgi:hypothetical protein
MQIIVANQAYAVDAGLSVDALKSMIENKSFIPADQIRLTTEGRVLEFGTLEANGVADEDELGLALEVEAGMRKKWRKKRSKWRSAERVSLVYSYPYTSHNLLDFDFHSASSSSEAQKDASTCQINSRRAGGCLPLLYNASRVG